MKDVARDESPVPVEPLVPRTGGRELFELAELDADAARRALNALPPGARAEACLGLHPTQRRVLLELLDDLAEVVPLIPETELLHTIRAADAHDRGWILAHTTQEQRLACIDIDCWHRSELELKRFRDWTDALIIAGGDTLLLALHEFDLETWILALRDMADIVIAEQTVEPYGYYTEDGIVFYSPHQPGDRERVRHIFATLLSTQPKQYWQLVYGVVYEDPYETEDYALRWRTGRMADLGFPERKHAMRAYRPLEIDEAPTIEIAQPRRKRSDLVASCALPVPMQGSLVARALRALEPALAGDMLGYVLAVANTIAVADQMNLSDPDSIPKALRKAIRGIDRGLRDLATRRNQAPHEVLATSRPLDLFRIGMTADAHLSLEVPEEEDLYEELMDLIGIQPDEHELAEEEEI